MPPLPVEAVGRAAKPSTSTDEASAVVVVLDPPHTMFDAAPIKKKKVLQAKHPSNASVFFGVLYCCAVLKLVVSQERERGVCAVEGLGY